MEKRAKDQQRQDKARETDVRRELAQLKQLLAEKDANIADRDSTIGVS